MYEDNGLPFNNDDENQHDYLMRHINDNPDIYDSDFQNAMLMAYWEVTEVS